MNPDIRVRSNNTGKIAGLILAIAALSLVVAFAVSFIPSSANAAGLPSWLHNHSWSNWHPNHSFHNNDNFDDNDDMTYTQCHNHLDDNSNGTIDLLDPACSGVSNDIPEALNQNLITDVNVASTTTLVAIDNDDDLLYFEITQAPQHGTLSVLPATAFTLAELPTITYTPDHDYVGTDSFNFKVNDGLAGENDPVGQIATVSITVNAPVVPPTPVCSTGVGSPLLVDVIQNIVNDPDSSVPGPNWALDTFTRHIQVWAEGDHYCAQADDNGHFTTFGGESGISPQSGAALPNVITGTMVGGTHGMISGIPNFDQAAIANPDCSVSGACDGLTGKWVAYYFGAGATYAYSPSPADATGNWAWTYNACGHGTWVNANAGNSGDILAAGDDCVVPVVDPNCVAGQHLDDHVCVNDPAPSNTGNGNGGGNGGGGSVSSGPLSIGFVNTNNGGGQVLGASTDLPSGCSMYLNGYLKKGSSNTADVKKLQTFLNKELGLKLPVTGVFGPMTFDAVTKFQTKYADDILKPWFTKGLAKDMNPSGYVYKMTAYKINLLQCTTLDTPAPQLP